MIYSGIYIVMDYAQHGEVMTWDADSMKFKPCIEGKEQFTEVDIQKILRDCIRGLDYSKKY